MVDRASLRVAGGIAVVIIILLASMILLARMQMPVEVATTPGDLDTQTAASDSDSSGDAMDDANAESDAAADDATNDETAADDAADESGEEADTSDADSEDASTDEASTGEASSDEGTASSDEEGSTDGETASDDGADESMAVAGTSLTHAQLDIAFAAGGCTSCHVIPNITGAVGQLGPDLSAIGTVAATRVEGLSAEEYIHQSLHEPDAFIVDECPTGPCAPNIMLASNLFALTDNEVEGMIQYLVSLTGDDSNTVAAEETEEEAALAEDDSAEGNEEATEEEVAEEPAAEEEAAEEVTEEVAEEEAAPVDMEAISAIVTKGTCGACHVIPGVDGAAGLVGPDLTNIGSLAATRIEGYSAEEYLLESILEPNAFIAPECPAGDCLPGLMLPNLADLLTADEIDMLISYLVTLDGE